MAPPKRDIKNKKDIQKIIETFYIEVKKDRLLKVFFKSFDDQWWEEHIPIMTAFWSNVVFYSEEYEGNPMIKHYKVNQSNKLTKNIFKRWLSIFDMTVNSLYEGNNAQLILRKAQSLGAILEERMKHQ